MNYLIGAFILAAGIALALYLADTGRFGPKARSIAVAIIAGGAAALAWAADLFDKFGGMAQ